MVAIFQTVCTGIIILLLVNFVQLICNFHRKQRRFNEICKHIRGFPRHWFFGNVHQMVNFGDFMEKIHNEFIVKMKRKLCVYWLFNQPVFVACHPDVAKIILRSSEPKPVVKGKPGYHFLQNWLGQGLLTSNGKSWERNRRLLTTAFHSGVLGSYFGIYNNVADIFLNNIAEASTNGAVEVSKLTGLATLDTLLRCILSYNGNVQDVGIHHPYAKAVQRLSAMILQRSVRIHQWPDFLYNISSDGKEFQRLCDYVHDFSFSIIKDRRKFLDILLAARDKEGKGLEDIEIQNEVDTFVFAGHDTTSCVLNWALYNLSQHKEIQNQIYKEVKEVLGDRKNIDRDDLRKLTYLNCFLKESMRFHTPVPIVIRALTQPCRINDITLPEGSHVGVFISSIHHHPDVWKDHCMFKPERFLDTSVQDSYSYCPFSAGPRDCIGMKFALNEVKVMIAKTVCRFEVLADQNHEPSPYIEVNLRSKNGIQVFFKERSI